MTTPTIAEIIKRASTIKSKEDKIKWLKENHSKTLKDILILTYDSSKKFLLPTDVEPPYTPSNAAENHGSLFTESRKFKYFVEGFSSPTIKQLKRESLFIEMLENVHASDAKILIQMIKQKPFKGITKSLVNETYGLELS